MRSSAGRIGSSGVGVTGCCELPDVGTGELNLVPLKEDAFLVAESSLWPEALTF